MGVPRVLTDEQLAAAHQRWLSQWERKYAHRWKLVGGKYYLRTEPEKPAPLNSQELLRRQQAKQSEAERLGLVGHNED